MSKINGMSIADNFWCAAINDSHNKQKSLNEPFLFLFLLSFPDRIYVFTSTRWIEKFYVAIVFFVCVLQQQASMRLVTNATPT